MQESFGSNFAFLSPEWPDIHASAVRVEQLALTDARGASFYARRTLELAVTWLYESDATLSHPYDTTLSALLHEPTFRTLVPREVWLKMRLLKDLGNEAVHSSRAIEERDGLAAARELFHVLYWLAHTYTRGDIRTLDGLTFDVACLSVEAKETAHTAGQLQVLQAQIAEREKREAEVQVSQAASAATLDAQIKVLQAEVAAAKKANSAQPDNHDYSEKETRDYFIDLLLREAGWPLKNKRDREYEVSGMPNEKGIGYVDYVLWGDDGLPLAVVEAKRTRKDARVGQRQAELYADCLEAQFGRRPLIFYTNGYSHWFWDDVHYAPREVQGFFKKDELELILQRRTSQKPLGTTPINGTIVERHYQTTAIRAVTEHFEKKQRRALLVMATGAGKTRTVIALSDLLQRAGWAKRILFLADRVALVKQAANAFKAFLPGLSPVNLVMEKEDTGSRILLSTYPTMMGMIDEAKSDGARRFGPGHFDLIVIDEAHRSVYKKYGAIFDYFDSLLVGLTATPKTEVDKNTYGLFDLENGVPTYAYELSEAVADGFLVPPRAVSVPVKFQREGIAYADLTDEEKDEWDAAEWGAEDGTPDKVDANAVNKWLFNTDTVDKVLAHLMTSGLKVDGGDRLGKTIIFAKNHKHALFIEERFNKNYPHLAGKFARVIDNYESYAQSLLDDFSTPAKNPHIAISVDMLDTGIDVPEIVNLVFFKLVRSKTKFFQMIGRGTRLRPDLFGAGKDKEFFNVFDYCGNLEFFGENPEGVTAAAQESLSQKIFLRRLELLQKLRSSGEDMPIKEGAVSEKPATYGSQVSLDTEIADRLHAEVESMNRDNFLVRPALETVEQYRKRESWETLDEESAHFVGEKLAGLPTELDPEDIEARQFDLLLLNLQIGLLRGSKSFPRLQKQVQEIAGSLEEKSTIPLVSAQMPLILEIQTEEWWQDVTLTHLELARKRLRDLVKFIDKTGHSIVYTDFEDVLGDSQEVTLAELGSSIDVAQYRKKVTQYLKGHLDHPVVKKLRDNIPVEKAELSRLEISLYALGGDEGTALFESIRQGKSLGVFIRGLVGLDREAAKVAFGTYLENTHFNTDQIAFINQIIDYLTKNGVMEPARLYEQPFTSFSMKGLDGIFSDKEADDIMRVVRSINANAGFASQPSLAH